MDPTPLNGSILFFAYDANLSRAHMALWCPQAVSIAKGKLADYRLVFRTWADIVASRGDEVQGALYEIGPKDLVALDEFEECPALTHHLHVTVRTADGPLSALAYQMNPGHALALPESDYLNLILEGYEDWGLDAGLLAVFNGDRAAT